MADRAQLETALINAHKAGDTRAARVLAREIKSLEPQIGDAEGLGAAATQGLTLGFADELGGLAATLASYLDQRPEAGVFEGMSFGDRYSALRDTARGRGEEYRQANPGKALVAEVGGGIGTGLLGGARLAGARGLELVGRSAATGGLLGAAGGAGYSEGETVGDVAVDAASSGAIGGLLGSAFPAAGQGLAHLGRKFSSVADDVGMQLTPGQRYNLEPLKRIESSAESNPIFSGAFNSLKQGNQKALNRAAAEAIGESTDDLSGDVLGAARARIGRAFDDLTEGRTVAVDNEFLGTLNGIKAELSDSNSATVKKALKFIQNTLEKDVSKGTITDKVYQDLSSEIAEAIMAKGTKAKSKLAFRQLKEALDGLFERNMGGGELDKFRLARSQWRNLDNISKAVDTGTGDVSGLKLANRLASKDAHGYLYGHDKSPLYQAARAAKKHKSIVGDSGTATRLSIPLLLGAGGAATGAATGMDPTTVGLLAAASPVAARAYLRAGRLPSGRALQNPYLVAPSATAGLLSQGP